MPELGDNALSGETAELYTIFSSLKTGSPKVSTSYETILLLFTKLIHNELILAGSWEARDAKSRIPPVFLLA